MYRDIWGFIGVYRENGNKHGSCYLGSREMIHP